MKLKGDMNGFQNGTFWGAQRFFIQYEAQLKKKKQAQKELAKKNPAALKRQFSEQQDDRAAKKRKLDDIIPKAQAVPLPLPLTFNV